MLVLLGGVPQLLHADSQSISVTPPLFQLSVAPGDLWQSSVRVVNPNNYPLTVYAEVVNFVPEGEGGRGNFVPVLSDDESKDTLAEWIDIAHGPYVIPEGQTTEISFIVEVPKNASPGGHFAAVLISTEPPKDENGSLALVTTQTVASLFFMRINGDVIEKGDIREFSVLDRSVELPEAEFSLRFENKGNVHVQPRGNIIITNMWGAERGIIPINNETHFGNVLPKSIRDFRFTWKGERSLADIGRYSAIATLAYGEDGIQTVTSTTYFWVIPVRGALITLASIIALIGAITWMIRLYIRRMLILAGVDPDAPKTRRQKAEKIDADLESVPMHAYTKVTAPLEEGTLDLRARLSEARETADMFRTIGGFILQYKRFFIALAFLIASFVGIVLYAGAVSKSDRHYEVTIDQGDTKQTLTSDELKAVDQGN